MWCSKYLSWFVYGIYFCCVGNYLFDYIKFVGIVLVCGVISLICRLDVWSLELCILGVGV